MAHDERLTLWQRRVLRAVVKQAQKPSGEPLTSDDWMAYFRFSAQPSTRFGKRMMRTLPSSPRCGYCGAPFGGFGARIVKPLGYVPSRKNPNICATCVELAPPGGITTEVGVLFADVRNFTARAENQSPAETNVMLRRFYAAAERVLFPEALIDKLIGDEVMALYLPMFIRPDPRQTAVEDSDRKAVAAVMLEHARHLLGHLGYGSARGPVLEIGIGLDYGEAFVGNVGDAAVHDFTAIGDVVNTASRLQGQAGNGEVVLSARLAAYLDTLPGEAEQLVVKGKQDPVDARRVRWF